MNVADLTTFGWSEFFEVNFKSYAGKGYTCRPSRARTQKFLPRLHPIRRGARGNFGQAPARSREVEETCPPWETGW